MRSRPTWSEISVFFRVSEPAAIPCLKVPSRPRDFHPEPLTDLNLILSHRAQRARLLRSGARRGFPLRQPRRGTPIAAGPSLQASLGRCGQGLIEVRQAILFADSCVGGG